MDQGLEPSFRDVVSYIRKGLLIAILAASAAAAGVYLFSRTLDPTYTSEAVLLATQPDAGFGDLDLAVVESAPLDLRIYRAAALIDEVVDDAVQRLVLDTGEPLTNDALRASTRVAVDAAQNPVTGLIVLRVSAPSAVAAAARANALAAALVAWDERRAGARLDGIRERLQTQVARLDARLEALAGQPNATAERTELEALRRQQVTTLRVLDASALGLLEVFEPARPPLAPVAPNPIRNAAVAFAVTLFAVYALLLLRDAMDVRLRSGDELSRAAGLPVLAELPHRGSRPLVESLDPLRAFLLPRVAGPELDLLLVTSVAADEGQGVVAVGLAEGFARRGLRTLLIDADRRHPKVAARYRLTADGRELSAYMASGAGQGAPVTVTLKGDHHLDVVPLHSASDATVDLLHDGVQRHLPAWRERYDVVVVNAVPVLSSADTQTLAPLASSVLLVSDLRHNDRRLVRRAVDLLQRVGAPLVGLVATHVSTPEGWTEARPRARARAEQRPEAVRRG